MGTRSQRVPRPLEYLHVYVTGTRWRDERGAQGEEPAVDLPFVHSLAKPELMRRLGSEGLELGGVIPGNTPGNPGGTFALIFTRPR
jgi:hypothetical protein